MMSNDHAKITFGLMQHYYENYSSLDHEPHPSLYLYYHSTYYTWKPARQSDVTAKTIEALEWSFLIRSSQYFLAVTSVCLAELRIIAF